MSEIRQFVRILLVFGITGTLGGCGNPAASLPVQSAPPAVETPGGSSAGNRGAASGNTGSGDVGLGSAESDGGSGGGGLVSGGSGGDESGGSSSGDTASGSGSAGSGGSGGSDVTGTVTWPDGTAAGNVKIEFYPNGYPYGGQSGGEDVVTDATGGYALSDCPCPDLGGLFTLAPSGGDWAHGGNQCYIMLGTTNGALTTAVQPGTRLDWSMLDMPCSRNYLLPQKIREEVANIEADPQELSAGPWQNARDRVGR